MKILELLFGKKNNTPSGDKLIKFTRHQNIDYPVNECDSVKLWNKPESNAIIAYARGSADGEGKIGFVEDKWLANYLSKGGLYEAQINKLYSSHLLLQIKIKNEFKTLNDYREEQRERWKKELMRKYSPMAEWQLSFVLSEKIKKNKLLSFGFNNKEITINNLDKIESNL